MPSDYRPHGVPPRRGEQQHRDGDLVPVGSGDFGFARVRRRGGWPTSADHNGANSLGFATPLPTTLRALDQLAQRVRARGITP
jgi:hypothetical protein